MKRSRSRQKAEAKPDCTSCGACCVSLYDQDAFCDIEDADLGRLGKSWVKRNVLFMSVFDMATMAIGGGRPATLGAIKTKWTEQRSGPLKGAEVCACVALKGSIMKSTRCSVYEKRPTACRVAVSPGDKTCLDIRGMFTEALKRLPSSPVR